MDIAEKREGARTGLYAHLAMILYSLLIAGSFSFGAIAAPHIPPAALNAIRFIAATAVMGGVLVLRRRNALRLPGGYWRFLFLGALMAAYFILMFVALRITDPVSTGAVFTLIPMMAAIFGYFVLGQKTRGLVWFSLLLSAVGALWVVFRADPARVLAFRLGRGEALFLIGCACQALYAPMVRLLNRGEGVFEFTVWTLAGCTLWLVIVALPGITAVDWGGIGLTVWLAIAYLALCSTAISFLLLQYASMHLPAAKVFPYGYLIPSFVIVLEALLGHGWTPPIIAAGALITTLGLVVLVATPDR